MTTSAHRSRGSATPEAAAKPTGERPPPPGLPEAIALGLGSLRDLTRPPAEVTSGALEHLLRLAAARHETSCRRSPAGPDMSPPLGPAAVAVRTACAHLSARDLAGAHSALRAAHDALPREMRQATTTEARAEGAAETQQRALGDQVGVDQAVGVLAQVDGVSPETALVLLRNHAQHHHFVLAELAADIVAGRVDARDVIGTTTGLRSR